MKKKVLAAVVLAAGLSSLWMIKSNTSEDAGVNEYDLVSASVEALATGEGTGNKGPREPEECHGGYKKMVCRNMNHIECTDSDCF